MSAAAQCLTQADVLLPLSEDKDELLFVYGILKRGFELDLEREGCRFVGEGVIRNANIYRIGGGVGLQFSDDGKVYGEIFRIPPRLWKYLDRIEGHPYTYRREQAEVVLWDEHDAGSDYVTAWVYVHQHPEYFGELIKSGRYERRRDEHVW